MLLKAEKLTKTQKKETINRLFEDSSPSLSFYLMLVLSSIIVSIGLILANIAIIIGGMLIAPILFPMLSLSMGITVGYPKLMRRAAIVIFQSIITVIVLSLAISLLFIEKELNPEIITRTIPNLAYFIIAIASGAAVAYAVARPNVSDVLPGVAISVALIPPLAASGISIAFLEFDMAVGAIGLFGINFIGIIFAAIFVFAIMNFYEAREQAQKKIKAEEKEIKEAQEEKELESLKEIKKNIQEAAKFIKKTQQKNGK